jgi:protein phosphatase PTC7
MTKEATKSKEELLDMSLSFGAEKLPHPDKMWTGGDDVFFVDKGIRALGVADGVSWWKSQGVDPGIFPKELMSRLKDVIRDRKAGKHPNINTLADALAYAHDATKATGSATVCVALLNPVTSAVHVLNVGDSGLWVLRRKERTNGWRVVWRAPTQRIQTNMPFQLSSERDVTNTAGDGALTEVKLKPGDLLVAASDGLWDNMHAEEMLQIVEELASGREAEELSPEKVAQKLASRARDHSLDPKYLSPIGIGGKPDDITVVAALATPSNKKPSAASLQLSALVERIRAREKDGAGAKTR